MSACGLHFHFKDAKRLSLSCGLIICLTAVLRLGLPPQGQHQPGPVLRHAGHPEETHREQEMTGRGRRSPHPGHLVRPPTSPPRQEHLGGDGGETSVPPPKTVLQVARGTKELQGGNSDRQTVFFICLFFWFLHRAINQPAGLFLLSLPHGRNSSLLSTSTPRLRRTRMHVGSRWADVFCVCACCRCARHVQCGCMCVKGQADNKTIPGCAAGAKTPHLDCAVKTDALPGAASENQRFDISRALKEHCSLESAGLIKKKK